jgi:hypothetical protein
MLGLETVMGAQIQCSLSPGPAVLITDPIPIFVEGSIAGTILDAIPAANIPPFPACEILGTCVPGTFIWVAGDPTVLFDGMPSLPQISIAPCLTVSAVLAVVTGGADDVGPGFVIILDPMNFTVFV